jgi:hypothetical protein
MYDTNDSGYYPRKSGGVSSGESSSIIATHAIEGTADVMADHMDETHVGRGS